MAESEQMIEVATVLLLAAINDVGREGLEDATMDVERVLDEHMLAITGGVSASANFETGCIEVDLVLAGVTISEIYQKLALIVMQLDHHGAIEIATPQAGETIPLPMTVQGSEMRRTKPESRALTAA